MEEFSKRVEEEYEALELKIVQLDHFIHVNNTFVEIPANEKVRLCKQLGAMESYKQVLLDRIEDNFGRL